MLALTETDVALLAAATLAILGQNALATMDIGKARKKFEVRPPATTGQNEDFDRYFRAHQNCNEFLPSAVFTLWIFGCFSAHWFPGRTVVPALMGAIYAAARFQYVKGYQQAVEKRVQGFYLATNTLKFMLLGSVMSVGKVLVMGMA